MDVPRKNSPWGGNPDSKRQTQYVLTHKWILDVKQMIGRLQSTVPEKLDKKEKPKKKAWMSFERGNI